MLAGNLFKLKKSHLDIFQYHFIRIRYSYSNVSNTVMLTGLFIKFEQYVVLYK